MEWKSAEKKLSDYFVGMPINNNFPPMDDTLRQFNAVRTLYENHERHMKNTEQIHILGNSLDMMARDLNLKNFDTNTDVTVYPKPYKLMVTQADDKGVAQTGLLRDIAMKVYTDLDVPNHIQKIANVNSDNKTRIINPSIVYPKFREPNLSNLKREPIISHDFPPTSKFKREATLHNNIEINAINRAAQMALAKPTIPERPIPEYSIPSSSFEKRPSIAKFKSYSKYDSKSKDQKERVVYL
jgi:hypothetical protein